MTKQKESLEELKLFVAKLMNEEQDKHARVVESLRNALGSDLGQDATKIINEIYKAKVEILNKVYDKIQGLQ